MLSPEQLNELETIVTNIYTNGSTENQKDILQTWFKNPEYFQPAKYIIETCIQDQSTPKLMLTHFALRVCCSLLDTICPTWELQDFHQMSQWCLSLYMNNIHRFMSVPLLMQAFCQMYAQLVVFGWHVSPEEFLDFINFDYNGNKTDFISPGQFDEFWEYIQIQNGSVAHWCGRIRLYNGIVERMTFIHNLETNQIKKFKEEPLFQCFLFAVKTLDIIYKKELPPTFTQDDTFTLIEYSLQLLNTCISFNIWDDSSQNENIEKFIITLPSSWRSYNNLTRTVHCLFQLYETSPPKLHRSFLNVLFLFSAIHSDVSSWTIPDRLKYAEPFFANIHKILADAPEGYCDNNENLPIMININLKVLLLVTERINKNLAKNQFFADFIQSVHAMTRVAFNTSFLLNYPDSIINILKFWGYLSKMVIQYGEVVRQFNISMKRSDDNKYDAFQRFKFYQFDESDVGETVNMIKNIKPMIGDVVDNYILLLNKVLEERPEAVHSVFLSDIKQTNSLMTNVLPIGRINGERFYTKILDTFNGYLNSYFEDPTNSFVELQLGLFALIISPPIFEKAVSPVGFKWSIEDSLLPSNNLQQSKSQPLTLLSNPFVQSSSHILPTFGDSEGENADQPADGNSEILGDEDEFSSAPIFQIIDRFTDMSMIKILELIVKTAQVIEKGFTNNAYIEEIVLFLISQFVNSPLINSSTIKRLPLIVSENTDFERSNDLHQLFIKRIITSISTFSTNNRIIALAMNAMGKWTKSDAFDKMFVISELLNVYYSTLGEIFDSMRSKHIRVQFHQIIGQFIDDQPEHPIFNTFFQKISERYNNLVQSKDVNLALGLILDLRGIVSGISNNSQAYFLSFNYIFPKLELIHQMALHSPILVIPYLKFLTEFTDMKKSRISFHQHSANGLKLAKTAMLFSIAFFDRAPKSLDQSSKGLYFTMKIMENIFTSPYSSLGAMIAYKDPILIDLFTSFLNFAHVVDFNDIVRYPKHLIQIIKLMDCLFANFSDFIVSIDISFLRTALIICTYSNNPTDYEISKSMFRVISNVTDCCVNLLGTPKGEELFNNTRNTFANVLQLLENFIIRMPFTIQYRNLIIFYKELIELAKNVLRMRPLNWPEVKHRLSLFLRSPLNIKTGELINDLVSIEYD